MTLACETCRRRKVRCSGSAPCTACERNKTECRFNYQRRRRGPRPKNRCQNIENAHSPESRERNPLAPDTIQGEFVLVDPALDGESYNSNRGTSKSQPQNPGSDMPIELWGSDLNLVFGGNVCAVGDIDLQTSHISHLLELFFTVVSVQHVPIIARETFLNRLRESDLAKALCYSICSTSVCFSHHQSLRSPDIGRELANASREILIQAQEKNSEPHIQSPGHQLDHLVILCALTMHEVHQGNGMQAWFDLTIALKLLISLKSQISFYSDPCLVQGIRQACRYLCVAEALYVTGPKIHSSSLGIATQPVTYQQSSQISPAHDEHLFDKEKRLLLDVLGLWRRIARFTQKDVTLSAPAPWAQGSEFWSLKQVLDGLPVAYYTHFCFDHEKLQCPPGDDSDLGEYLFYIGMLHTLQMLLHRVFLPTSVATKTAGSSIQKPSQHEPDEADIQRHDSTSNLGRRTVARGTVTFPGAPRLFLEERVAACVRSATSITGICETIISKDMLIPPFLGYTLYLAGLIFLNQLYAETVPEALDEHVENLKTVFMILSAMREFYAPAHVWVESLYQVHSLAQPSEISVILNKKAFSHFFSRFGGIAESSFCPLELGQSVLEQAMSSSTLEVAHLLQPASLSDRDPDMDSETSETSQRVADDYSGWLDDYQAQLDLINSN